MSKADQLAKPDALRTQGVFSEAELAAEPARLLEPPAPSNLPVPAPWALSLVAAVWFVLSEVVTQ